MLQGTLLLGMVAMAGLAVLIAALLAISLRRAQRRKDTRHHAPTEVTDAWTEAGRRGRTGRDGTS